MPGSEDGSTEAAAFVARYEALVPGRSSPLWNEQMDALRAAVERGDWRWLASVSDATREHSSAAFNVARSSALYGLALVREPAALDAFLSRVRELPPWERAPHRHRDPLRFSRMLGALLGYGQREDAIERAVERYGEDPALVETLTCWVQDAVTRGQSVGELPGVQRFWAERASAGHPLAALPLTLRAIEVGAMTEPPHRADTLGNWFYFARHLSVHGREGEPGLVRARVSAESPLSDEARARCAGAFADPPLFPNGRWEAREFALDERAPADGPRSVRGLPLECLAGPIVEAPVRERVASAQEVFGTLLHYATQGGAYAVGRSAAFGRLYAWRSLRALCGAPAERSIAECEALADRAWFTAFESDSRWFYRVCMDIGVACVRPDGRSLMVFAGSDSD